MRNDIIKLGMIVPGLPHPLLCPEKNKGWNNIRDGFEIAAESIDSGRAKSKLDSLVNLSNKLT